MTSRPQTIERKDAMNSVQHTPQVQHISLDESVARKFLRAYDLLHECARSDNPAIRRSSSKARVALGPVVLALDLRREIALDEGEFQGLFMDG